MLRSASVLRGLHVERYRSLKNVSVALSRVNVVVGPNGSGKTNLYRALKLVQDACAGRLARTLVDEGGMPSIEFAGPRSATGKARIQIRAAQDDATYALRFGVIPPEKTRFALDPEVKSEVVANAHGTVLVQRKGLSAWLRSVDGKRDKYPIALLPSESVLSQLRERHRYPAAADLVDLISTWRFHHDLRTDGKAPVRMPQVATRTVRLDDEGRDLAALMQTIREIGDGPALNAAVEDAFPGSKLVVEGSQSALSIALTMPGLLRPLQARELSDGTLRYLLLIGALLAPRMADLIAFNEPEASLHPSLLPPLARLLAKSDAASQLIVTTHSTVLADALLAESPSARKIEVALVDGETRIVTNEARARDDYGLLA
jgi:predicted ATPase